MNVNVDVNDSLRVAVRSSLTPMAGEDLGADYHVTRDLVEK